MKTIAQPGSYVPLSPSEFIGSAAAVGRTLSAKAISLLKTGDPARLILHGVPGTGKSRLAEMFARHVSSHAIYLEKVNGRNVTSEVVRRWQDALHYKPLSGGYVVKLINEIDACTPSAKDILNDYLDDLPRWFAVVGTSNAHLPTIVERFETRFQQFHVEAPDTDQLVRFLKRWKLPLQTLRQIAVGSGGNVRAALLDTQSILDTQNA